MGGEKLYYNIFMKKYLLIILCLFVSGVSFGQFRQGGKLLKTLTGTEQAVERAAATQVVPAYRSVVTEFHQMTCQPWLESQERSSAPEQAAVDKPLPGVRGPYKRSRESLLLELSALHSLPDNYTQLSREKLEEYLNTHHVYTHPTRVDARYTPSREVLKKSEWERLLIQEKWARTQPDYFPENYLNNSPEDFVGDEADDDLLYLSHIPATQWPDNLKNTAIAHLFPRQYPRPFHPAVKSLKILVVNDMNYKVAVLKEAALENPRVKVDWAPSLQEALIRLSSQELYQYDAILLDWVLSDVDAKMIPMCVWNAQLKIPVILYSGDTMSPSFLLGYNIVGHIDPVGTPWEAVEVINYVSNIVATGRAFPNEKTE